MGSPWSTTWTGFPLVQSHFILSSPAMSLGSFGTEEETSLASWCLLPLSAVSLCQCTGVVYPSAGNPATSQCFWTLLKAVRQTVQWNIMQNLDLSSMYFEPTLLVWLGGLGCWAAVERASAFKELLLLLQHLHRLLTALCFYTGVSECFSAPCFWAVHLNVACNE